MDAPTSPEHLICSNGHVVPLGFAWCRRCGARVNSAAVPAPHGEGELAPAGFDRSASQLTGLYSRGQPAPPPVREPDVDGPRPATWDRDQAAHQTWPGPPGPTAAREVGDRPTLDTRACPHCGASVQSTLYEQHVVSCGAFEAAEERARSAPGVSTWGPLVLSILVFAPIGLVMALWRLAKHYGSYREVVALVVSSAQILAVVVVVVVAVALQAGSYQGPSEHVMEQAVLGDLHKTTGNGFDVPNAASVVCNLPPEWQPGKTGTCYVYNNQSTGIGTVAITVEPTAGTYWRWNSQWRPGS